MKMKMEATKRKMKMMDMNMEILDGDCKEDDGKMVTCERDPC